MYHSAPNVLKLLLILSISFICDFIYKFIYEPWRVRKKYLKYPNVTAADKFHPLLGDIKVINENLKHKKWKMQNWVDDVIEGKQADLRLFQIGNESNIHIVSTKALEEFEKAVPHFIDRGGNESLPIGRLFPGNYGHSKSTENWKQRRKDIATAIGMNKASKYIKMMIEIFDQEFKKVPINQKVDFTDVLSQVTFLIITKIFFGKDIIEKIGKCKYTCPKTREVSYITFEKLFKQNALDQYAALINPKGKLFPFLDHWKLVDPYKTNAENAMIAIRTLEEF